MCRGGFELQRGRNYTREVTVTLTAPGSSDETFGFVITSSAFQIVFFSCPVWLSATFWAWRPINVCSWTPYLGCLHHFESRGLKSNTLQHFEARLASKLLIEHLEAMHWNRPTSTNPSPTHLHLVLTGTWPGGGSVAVCWTSKCFQKEQKISLLRRRVYHSGQNLSLGIF